MKTIGLLGGMSWESTVAYYQIINRAVGERLGGLHSAQIVLHSVDFHEIEQLQHAARWDEAGALLAEAAAAVEAAGADFLVLCTNTMHKVAPQIASRIEIPLLHIADATGAEIRAAGLERVALLGTRFTMEDDFYRGHLRERFELDLVVPPERDRVSVHRVIYEELCRGKILESSRAEYLRIIARLVEQGAEGVILGCTEMSLLLDNADGGVPFFDTTAIHAQRAALLALEADADDSVSC